MKKKRLIMVFLILLSLTFFSACSAIPGEETEVIEETTASKYFDETIMPLVINYGATVLGVATALIAILSKLNKSRKGFEGAAASIEALNFYTKRESEKIKAREQEIVSLQDEIGEIKKSQEKLLEICKIAFTNDKNLVVNGYAKDIAKVVKDETKNKA